MDVYSNQNLWYLTKIYQSTIKSYNAIGYQQLTVTGTAQGLTVPAGAIYALIAVESTATGVAVRFLELGTSPSSNIPTTTTGIGRSSLDVFDVSGAANLANFQVIQAQSGTHTLNIQYYAFA